MELVIPNDTDLQSIEFAFDNSAQSIMGSAGTLDTSQGYVVPEVLRELAKKGILANHAVAVREFVSADDPQDTGGDHDRPSTSKDKPGQSIVFTLKSDNTVEYQAKSLDFENEFIGARSEGMSIDDGLANGFADDMDLINAITSDDSIDPDLTRQMVDSLVKYKSTGTRPGELIAARPATNARPEEASVGLMHKDKSDFAIDEQNLLDSLVEYELTKKNAQHFALYFTFKGAIFHGLLENPGPEKVAFANPDIAENVHLSDTLRLAEQSSSYTDWLSRYGHLYGWLGQVSQLQQLMDHFQSEEAKTRAFETLKRRIQADSYFIHRADIGTVKGAAEINAIYENDFAYIELPANQLPGPCNRRRRSANTGSCDARRKALVYALRLLSGYKTQLYLDDNKYKKGKKGKKGKTDIALREPSNESERWLQNFFTRFRRLEGKDALAHVRGIHSVIALDEDSFTRAQQQIKDGTLSGQPLLLKTTPSGSYVLLTPGGRVQSAIAGGDGNRVTVLGRPAGLIAHALATLVDFTPDRYIASLTVSDLAGSNQSRGITALNGLKTFMTRLPTNGKPRVGELIIETRSRSPEVFKRLVKDIQRLMPKDRPAIETLVLRSPGTGQPEYRLLPGEKTVLMSPRPSDSKAPLRYLPPSQLSVPVPPRTKDSLSGVASERSEFRQRLLEFDTALRDIKARHSLPDSMIPQLDTLRRDGRGWRIDFLEPDTLARKNIQFTSGAFDRFRGFLKGMGHPTPSRLKGKKAADGSWSKLRSCRDLFDLITGIAPAGFHYKNPPSQNMTDTERQIYTGRQVVFFAAVTLQGIEIIDLGRQGLKLFTPNFKQPFSTHRTAPKLPGTELNKPVSGLKKAGRLGKKAARFLPFLGSSVPAASLTLTVIDYENEKDPEVKELKKSMVIFESVDLGISIASDFLGPLGLTVDGLMHFVRAIFVEDYKEKLATLAYKKLREASGKAAHIFNPIHAQLDPKRFLANNQTLNALISGDGKNLLNLNIQSINLVNKTLTYGGVYTHGITFVAKDNGDWNWKKCKEKVDVPHNTLECPTYTNRLDRSPAPFNLINDALKTLCRKESRLIPYQCSNGVFHNLGQMSDKKIILMPAVPALKLKLEYTDIDQNFQGSAPDSSSPGAQLLDAVSDDKLKRIYQKKVKDTKVTRCVSIFFKKCKEKVTYTYKYLGKMFTHTSGHEYLQSTSSLNLDKNDHIVVFRWVSDEFSRLLYYDLYSPKGANNTYVLVSNGDHVIRIHPQGHSTWVLNYDGKRPYACITERDDLIQNCSSWLSQTRNPTWDIRLGETLFRFPVPVLPTPYEPIPSYEVVVQDPNARFKWLPDRKVIHHLYDTGTLNDRPSRASKLNRIMSRYTAARRFLPLKLKDCDASFQLRQHCMAGAPNRWTTDTSGWSPKIPNRWAMNGALDPLPKSHNRQNPAWLQHKRDCDRQVNEYLKQPYRCFPDKLGLAEADWDQLGRVRLWYDTLNYQEIRLIAASAQPVQGNPATGYYFFDSANGKVLFQNKVALTREIRHFGELNAGLFVFGRHVSKVMPNKDESQLLVFDPPYYYLLTASPSGQLTHQVIAAETLDGQLSVPPIPPAAASDTTTSDHGLIPMRVVYNHEKRHILRAGFYDNANRTYIAFLSSLLDGGALSNTDDESRLRTINERVRRALRKEHLPVRKVVRGRGVHYILFSEHSGNLYYMSTDVKRHKDIQRLSSGFQMIRPVGEHRTVAQMASQHIFTRVQAHSGSLLADTLGGYRLWIPDKAWDNTRVFKKNLSMESGRFERWQVEATGQTVAKSNDTLTVRQFTPQSGVVIDSLDPGQIVNHVFVKMILTPPSTAWTTANARFFIRELKERLRTGVEQVQEEFSATVGLLPLKGINAITEHPLFSAIRQLDFWYYLDGDTLLAANTRDQFKVMVNEDGQLLALSDTRKEEAFEFFLQPDQGAKGHPFCGKAAAASLTRMPSEFDDLISIPCRYMAKRIDLRGRYQWEPSARAWRIQTPKAQYLANRRRLALVRLDLSQMGPRKASHSRLTQTLQDFEWAMRSLPSGVRSRIDAGLIALKLRPGYAWTQVAWVDYRGRYSRQQRVLFGLPGEEYGVQQLIGQTSGTHKKSSRFLRSKAAVVYSPDKQMLYRVTSGGYQSLGTFNKVAVMAEGLLLSGTPGANWIRLKALRLDTYYHEHRVAFVQKGIRQKFGVMVEGQGGADVIELDETDLSFFARILIHPGLAENDTADHDRAQTLIVLNAPAFLFNARRWGQSLMLKNRFTRNGAEIEIQQVWARQYDRFLQPTTLVFSDLELPLSDLAARMMDSGQWVVLPLTVSSLVRKERLRFINATASNPLYIEQNQPVKIVTYRAMDGIKLTLEPLDPTYIRRQVFITSTGQWGWEPGSVQVSGPEPGSGYQSWPFIPAVISSSAMGNGTARLWGNSRNNILYLGADARQWSLRGWGGHDLLLLGASENTAPRPEVLANRGDRCDNRRLDTPGNSSLWQAILDWTRPLAGGVGNDVYDLRACRPARTIDSRGKHYILLSSRSKADLRHLSGDNSTALFFTDLTAEHVAFSQCEPQAQSNLTRSSNLTLSSNLTRSNHSLPLGSQTFRIINTRNNQTLALVKPEVLASLHFKGGQVSLNPMTVINRNDSALALDDSVDGDNGALAFLNKIIGRGQRLVNYLCSLAGGKKNDIGSDSARPVRTSLNDTELYQHYQRLVQDLSALSGSRSGESPSFIPSASQGMIKNLTSPQPLTTMSKG
ncbi:hypothetical protein [Endozoicomonas sp. 8E]|uniref:hypothetical protein n=1 Tax=Endozoicomonas sp. 8E TaxID=3035692 RepID=UPI00293921DD|nr:hypothetical protein [Endozoicomonas sp. 8E]WOG29793.1 hypothetical protein P6910_09085 [Endozoicomonas sp. 8E]